MDYVSQRFVDVKRWSIAPTILNGHLRTPANQLLESDIIYIKNPLLMSSISDVELMKFAVIAHYCFQSFDFSAYMFGLCPQNSSGMM